MYEYTASHGTVQWNPEHTAHAIAALQEHIDGYEHEEGVYVDVDKDTREAIKASYYDLLTNDENINYPPDSE